MNKQINLFFFFFLFYPSFLYPKANIKTKNLASEIFVPGRQSQASSIVAAPGVGKDINIQLNIPIQTDSSNRNMLTNTVELFVELKNKLVNYIQINTSLQLNNHNHIFLTAKQNIETAAKDIVNRSFGLVNQTKQLVFDHKFKLITMGFISFYAYLLFKTMSINKYLKQDTLWSSWKSGFAMNQLLAIPQKQFAQELATRIQAHYMDKSDPTNTMAPFMQFMRDVEYEKAQLQQHIALYKWIRTLKIWRLFPFCIETPEKLNERIQRIVYFKNCFSSWFAEYKLSELTKAVHKTLRRLKKKQRKLSQTESNYSDLVFVIRKFLKGNC